VEPEPRLIVSRPSFPPILCLKVLFSLVQPPSHLHFVVVQSAGMQIPTSLLGLMRCRYPLPLKAVHLVENSLSFNHDHLNISCPDIPCVLENSVGGAARSTQLVTLCIMVNITLPNLYSSLPSIPTEDHVLPQKKLLYQDTFNFPLPNIFYPCHITKPSNLRLAMLYHRVGKRCRLLVLRISPYCSRLGRSSHEAD
jgi:hypothetical protein